MFVRTTGEQPHMYVDCVQPTYPTRLGELHHLAVKHVSRLVLGEALLKLSRQARRRIRPTGLGAKAF